MDAVEAGGTAADPSNENPGAAGVGGTSTLTPALLACSAVHADTSVANPIDVWNAES